MAIVLGVPNFRIFTVLTMFGCVYDSTTVMHIYLTGYQFDDIGGEDKEPLNI